MTSGRSAQRVGAEITAARQATPTVKTLSLRLEDPEFTFLPGQWVDCFVVIDGRQEVAGFSITSSPAARGSVSLAVKLVGDNRVTSWVHDRARVGDRVEVELGGDFHYQRHMSDSIVLIAAGIGINPIVSIMRYEDDVDGGVKTALFYSGSHPSELLFEDDLRAIASRHRNVRCIFTMTRSSNPSGHNEEFRTGRIDAAMLVDAEVDLSALFYLCGPPEMMTDMLGILSVLGVPNDRIKYEWWWDPEGQRVPRGVGRDGHRPDLRRP